MIVSKNAENSIKLYIYIYISILLPRVEYVYSTTHTGSFKKIVNINCINKTRLNL